MAVESRSVRSEAPGSDAAKRNYPEPSIQVSPETRIKDPLSDITRKERRSLLGISAIGIVIVKIGLVPEKISALGIDFTTHNQQAFLHFLGWIVLFYSVAFMIYATSDFITWRLSFITEFRTMLAKRRDPSGDPLGASDKEMLERLENKWSLFSTATSAVRTAFEFVVPLIVASYSVISLFSF
jgi:hypothetical protein